MLNQTRRGFAKSAGIISAAAMATPALKALGANEKIRLAVCGVNGQGANNARQFQKVDDVQLVALCDPDTAVLDRRIKDLMKSQPAEDGEIKGHVDFREVLDRKDIDAVCICTPNHWHALMTIMACQAGKDVYCEKPLSHTYWEGRKVVEAAEKYGRIVQTGTQNRSDVGLRELYPWIEAGNIGKVTMVRGLCYRDRNGIGKIDKPLTPPDTVDYNLWLGPAQDLPMRRPRLHYDWHWDWNTGNGDTGNQGPHEMDLIRWAMQDKGMPTRVVSFGGRFGWDDGGNTPNMHFAIFDYNGVPVFFETINLQVARNEKPMPAYKGTRVGVIISCEGGYFAGGRGGGWVYDNDGKKVKQFPGDGGGGHHQNFAEAVRNRKTSHLHAPAINGHLSAGLMHIANISYLAGAQGCTNKLQQSMGGDPNVAEAIDRYGEQLAKWNIDFKKEPWTIGASLNFDAETETFNGSDPMTFAANAMLSRAYRKPWIVPDQV